MPIYEYQCQSCGHHQEEFQKISDAPLTDCPVCHKPDMTKLVSAASFQLKGTGWYATDFKDKGKPKPAVSTESSSGDAKKDVSSTDKSSDGSSGSTKE